MRTLVMFKGRDAMDSCHFYLTDKEEMKRFDDIFIGASDDPQDEELEQELDDIFFDENGVAQNTIPGFEFLGDKIPPSTKFDQMIICGMVW